MPEYPGQTTKQNKVPTKENKRLVTVPDNSVRHSADGLSPAMALPSIALNDLGNSLGVQASRLGDQRFPITRRQALATTIGQILGNRHLQTVTAQAVQRQGGTAGGAAPVPESQFAEVQHARAVEALKAAYGAAIVQTGQVLEVDASSFHALHDQFNISRNAINPRTNEEWKTGDSLENENSGNTCYGFSDPAGILVIPDRPGTVENEDQNRVATIAHEILHLCVNASFKAPNVLADVEEGVTEYLATKAISQAGYSGIMAKYKDVMPGVQGLASVVGGMATMQAAYFGGKSILVAAFDKVRGPGAYDTWEALALSDKEEAGNFLGKGIRPKWMEKQKSAIFNLLKDFTIGKMIQLQNLFNEAFIEEKAAIRYDNAINGRVNRLSDDEKSVVKGILGI
jgi:hypothetical protein